MATCAEYIASGREREAFGDRAAVKKIDNHNVIENLKHCVRTGHKTQDTRTTGAEMDRVSPKGQSK